MGLVSGVGCVGASSACVGALELIFQIGFGCGIFGFLVDFGWFWEAKMVPKINVWENCSMLFFERSRASILGGLFEA